VNTGRAVQSSTDGEEMRGSVMLRARMQFTVADLKMAMSLWVAGTRSK
jgi:hypothetical protein